MRPIGFRGFDVDDQLELWSAAYGKIESSPAIHDLDGPQPTWTLPSERSKNHKAHTLPLMPMALDIIRLVPKMASRNCLFGVHSDKVLGQGPEGARRAQRRVRLDTA